MFTIPQIKEAHFKVKSGADFPAYIQALITLGVSGYETYVADGHTNYFGKDNYSISSEPKYAPLNIADESNKEQFQHYLKIHQQGQTSYPEFCNHSAETGVEKWVVLMNKMTCAYFDKAGNTMLEEKIPVVSN